MKIPVSARKSRKASGAFLGREGSPRLSVAKPI
jgi:hypothetical protein